MIWLTPFEKMQVGFGFHIERRGAEDGRVQPCPGFGRRDGAPVEMTGGRRPARGRKLAPLPAFAFGQIHQRVARKAHRRCAVGLRAEPRAVPCGPFVDRRQVIFIDQFSQRLAPVVADRGAFFADVAGERGKIRRQIVTAAAAEFIQEIGRPIRAVDFQAVAKDRVRRVRDQGVQQRLADGVRDAHRPRNGRSDPARILRRPMPPASPSGGCGWK